MYNGTDMNETTKKTTIAVILNLLLPGSGYVYLKAKNRLWIAIPLLLLAIYNIGYICFALSTGGAYPYDRNLSPFTQTGMVHISVYNWFVFFVISIDTWDVARKLHLKGQNKKTKRATPPARKV